MLTARNIARAGDLANAGAVLLVTTLALTGHQAQFRAAVLDPVQSHRQEEAGRRLWSAKSPVLRLTQQAPATQAAPTEGAAAAAVKDASPAVPPITRVRPKAADRGGKVAAPSGKSALGKAGKAGKADKGAAKTAPSKPAAKALGGGRSSLGAVAGRPLTCARGFAYDARRLRCVPATPARAVKANKPRRR